MNDSEDTKKSLTVLGKPKKPVRERAAEDAGDAAGASSSDRKQEVIEALKKVEDPELLLDIWFIGLIYSIVVDGGKVDIDMTFTTPACPAGPQLVGDVKEKVGALDWVTDVAVNVVFQPPWQASDELKALMGYL